MTKVTDWICLAVIVFFVGFVIFLEIENKALEKNLKNTLKDLYDAYEMIDKQNKSIDSANKSLQEYNATINANQETIELLRKQTKKAISSKSCEETRKILIETAKENR